MFSTLESTSLILPKSSLGYNTNNQYSKFPPIMADGRSIFSTWQSESQINDQLIKNNNIMTNWEYRKFLTKNATTIMEYNFRESANDTGYMFPTKEAQQISTMKSSYTFDSLNDRSNPFQQSDLKEIYLTREQLNAKKVAPTLLKEYR